MLDQELQLTYPEILQEFGTHLIQGRLESRAFLGWFLEHYYRLDETDAQDSICDGPDDKGIDGIYVDQNLETIDVFQAKLYQNSSKSLGDTALKEFAGTLAQLATPEAIASLVDTTGNHELRELIRTADLSALVTKGYEVRGIFITNASADANAINYLKQSNKIVLHDGKGLLQNWIPPGESAPVQAPVSFHLDHDVIEYKTPEATVFIAAILASELVGLPGLESGQLFDWNVRQALGRTKVNRAIAGSIEQQFEHKNFLLYHNGLTILAENASLQGSQLIMDGYTVVNGCQSLTTLFENRTRITDELRLLARVIKLPPQNELAAKITRHSNNQNSISARDLQSNSTMQRRLKTEIERHFSSDFEYEIKRGETRLNPEANLITNEEAARNLLAFDLQQPWSCHQSYRLFDELHAEIFGRPEVTGERIVILEMLRIAVTNSLDEIKNTLIGNYRLTRYFLLYLLRQALELDTTGKRLIQNASSFTDEFSLQSIYVAAESVITDLIIDFNAEVDDREMAGAPFDYKRELKSPSAVRNLARQIIPNYEKAIRRARASSFSDEIAKANAE